MTERVTILSDALTLTTKDRHETYGDFVTNLKCFAELKEVYRRYAGEKYSMEHDTSMEMALGKISRIACGTLHRDNYVDAPNYIAAAYEAEQAVEKEADCRDFVA